MNDPDDQYRRLSRTALGLAESIIEGYCDGVTIARPLIANNDLPQISAAGRDLPRRPCIVLQPLPGQRRREPARLLRRAPLRGTRRPRGDARGGHERLPSGSVRRAHGSRPRASPWGGSDNDVEHIPDEGP